MEQREKLIDLLQSFQNEYQKAFDSLYHELSAEADYLIANGVVVLPCRCGECKHFYKYNCHSDNMRMNMCKLAVGTDGEDFFCPYGERKGGE